MQKITCGFYLIQKASFVVSVFLLVSCSFSFLNKDTSLTLVDFNDLEFDNIEYQKSLTAFLNSCKVIAKYEEEYQISRKLVSVRVVDYRDACENALNLQEDLTREKFVKFLKQHFKVYKLKNNRDSFFTGYFLPEIEASFEYSDTYKYPIYKSPATLDNIKHLLSRKEINNGALQHLNLEIAWAKNDIDLFFLHIQGSGVLRLPDGERYLLSYDKSNGHQYYAIGKYLKEHKKLVNINGYSIREWLSDHPEQKNTILNMNASFIFFKLLPDIAVLGAEGSILTADGSIAIDKTLYPYGLPMLIETKIPDYYNYNQVRDYSNILITQDTGSDIIGKNRGDIYFGYGKKAQYQANLMKYYGKMYIFIPNNAIAH